MCPFIHSTNSYSAPTICQVLLGNEKNFGLLHAGCSGASFISLLALLAFFFFWLSRDPLALSNRPGLPASWQVLGKQLSKNE